MDQFLKKSKNEFENIIDKLITELPRYYDNMTEKSIRDDIHSILGMNANEIKLCKGYNAQGKACRCRVENDSEYCGRHRLQDPRYAKESLHVKEPEVCSGFIQNHTRCCFPGNHTLHHRWA